MSSRAWRWSLIGVVCLVFFVVVVPRGPLLVRAARYGRAKTVRMPVEGLRAQQTQSSWHAPRSGGRRHEGIDLFAKRGAKVVSATRGEVWRVGDDALGGHVVTVLGEGPALYYYAHLDDPRDCVSAVFFLVQRAHLEHRDHAADGDVERDWGPCAKVPTAALEVPSLTRRRRLQIAPE
jgi:Peptidase family M23